MTDIISILFDEYPTHIFTPMYQCCACGGGYETQTTVRITNNDDYSDEDDIEKVNVTLTGRKFRVYIPEYSSSAFFALYESPEDGKIYGSMKAFAVSLAHSIGIGLYETALSPEAISQSVVSGNSSNSFIDAYQACQ